MKNHISTLNWHLTKACNMKCKFCYAVFEDIKAKRISYEDGIQLLLWLAESGKFKKINFAGGEPTLIPFLSEYIIVAKNLGFETSIVTNGSKINEAFLNSLQGKLDILTLSIDSLQDEVNVNSGRTVQGQALSKEEYFHICELVQSYGIHLKINTVVNQTNKNEFLAYFINLVKPFRWKVLQATHIDGQNDESMLISAEEFNIFVAKNTKYVQSKIKCVIESSDVIQGSYLMIDQLGRFYDSSTGKHQYSDKILDKGVDFCLNQVYCDVEKFTQREGLYSVYLPYDAA